MTQDRYSKFSMDDLKRRQEATQQQIGQAMTAILKVLVNDVPRFVEREARKRWLEHVEFSSTIADEALKSFKDNLRALGKEESEDLLADFGNISVWLVEVDPENTKSLGEHDLVQARFNRISTRLMDLLETAGFPFDRDEDEGDSGTYSISYHAPLYFVDGVYCVSLIEDYWKHLREFNALKNELEGRQAATSRQVLEERWNQA